MLALTMPLSIKGVGTGTTAIVINPNILLAFSKHSPSLLYNGLATMPRDAPKGFAHKRDSRHDRRRTLRAKQIQPAELRRERTGSVDDVIKRPTVLEDAYVPIGTDGTANPGHQQQFERGAALPPPKITASLHAPLTARDRGNIGALHSIYGWHCGT